MHIQYITGLFRQLSSSSKSVNVLTFPIESLSTFLKYVGVQVMRVKLPHPKQKYEMIIAQTGGDLKILSQGIYEI